MNSEEDDDDGMLVGDMVLDSYLLDSMLKDCEDYARKQDYCWFRITFSKIGQTEPQWVVWFEGPGGADTTFSGATLPGALQKLADAYGL